MNNYLSIDVGTTCCKCQLFSEEGNILEYISKEYDFKKIENEIYVDIEMIKDNVMGMIKEVLTKHPITSICISSFGESFVLLDRNDNIVFYPMVYTDSRGEKEAKELTNIFKEQYYFNKTGVVPQAMFSISKLLYIRNNYLDIYNKADKALLICDYVGYLLTGERIIDYSLASRTAVFNINNLDYDLDILNRINVDKGLFSRPMPTGTIVGSVKEDIKKELNTNLDIKVILGSHDQVCNAIGCGCLKPGDATDGIGTVECITPIFDFKSDDVSMAKQGIPIVPFLNKGLYCTYICNYASNSITNWFKNEIAHKYKDKYDDFFDYIEDKMSDEINDVYCMPYFAGNCIPYLDIDIKGAFIGLTTSTSDSDMYKSIIEGLAMEMRLEVETGKKYGINVSKLIATGGGSLSKKRLQIKADVQDVEVSAPLSQEGGLCGCAIIQAVALGQFKTYEEACKVFVKLKETYYPNIDKHNQYEDKYNNYKKMYENIKNITRRG